MSGGSGFKHTEADTKGVAGFFLDLEDYLLWAWSEIVASAEVN